MRLIWVMAGLGLAAASSAWPADTAAGLPSAAQPSAAQPLAAVWKEQHLSFFYMGRTARYSCDGLRDKVRAMLLDLGARRDLSITALGCDDSAPRARPGAAGPSLALVFAAPALPDPNAKPRHVGDLSTFNARFEAFTIAGDAFRNMGVADCELVQEFAHQILPRLVTRDLKQDISCGPLQQSGGRFLVRGEILKAFAPR